MRLVLRLQQLQHFSHGLSEDDVEGAADNAVADIQFHQVRHPLEMLDVAIVQSMTRIDF